MTRRFSCVAALVAVLTWHVGVVWPACTSDCKNVTAKLVLDNVARCYAFSAEHCPVGTLSFYAVDGDPDLTCQEVYPVIVVEMYLAKSLSDCCDDMCPDRSPYRREAVSDPNATYMDFLGGETACYDTNDPYYSENQRNCATTGS